MGTLLVAVLICLVFEYLAGFIGFKHLRKKVERFIDPVFNFFLRIKPPYKPTEWTYPTERTLAFWHDTLTEVPICYLNTSIYRQAQTKPLEAEVERFAYDVESTLAKHMAQDMSPEFALQQLPIRFKQLKLAVETRDLPKIRKTTAAIAALNMIISCNTKALYGQ